jgi:outer membrane protein OmpA-like peptidoglycan-associated protein
MSTDTTLTTRSHEENWQPVLELAVEEVFEIMLGCRVKPVAKSEHPASRDFTAMVGLAGALCGILTICCSSITAHQLAKTMLGAAAESEDQVGDALGEICNMVTGNFESASAKMKSASQPAFDRIASMLREGHYRLRIEGHTDNAPIHNSEFPSNWELSTARATEIVRLLIVRDGFIPDRLSAAGYAEYHSIASNRTLEGRGANRRVDIIILSKFVSAGTAVQSKTDAKSEAKSEATTAAKTSAPAVAPRTPKPAPHASVRPGSLQPASLPAMEGRLPH